MTYLELRSKIYSMTSWIPTDAQLVQAFLDAHEIAPYPDPEVQERAIIDMVVKRLKERAGQ